MGGGTVRGEGGGQADAREEISAAVDDEIDVGVGVDPDVDVVMAVLVKAKEEEEGAQNVQVIQEEMKSRSNAWREEMGQGTKEGCAQFSLSPKPQARAQQTKERQT